MLRKFTLCLAIVLAISMALIGCTSSPTTTSAPPAPAATSAAPASTAPPAFKYNNLLLKSNYHAAEAVITKGQNIFGDAITKATGGAVTFQHNYMGALGPSAEQVKNLGAGSFDMALLVIGYYQGDLPLYNAFMLPNLTADPLVIAKAGTELMTMPELENELKKVNLKALYVTGATSYEYMGNKPIKTPDDFKGLNIRVTGQQATALAMLGAKPINIDTTETAMAIQKGTVDGAILPYTTFNSMGIHEVCKYATFYGQGVSGYLTVMNLDKWNSLQPELKALMTDVAKTIPVEHSKLWEAEGKRILDTWKAKNVEITDFTAAQRAEITKRLVPAVWDSWIKSTQDKGGQKVLDALQAAIKKYEGTK